MCSNHTIHACSLAATRAAAKAMCSYMYMYAITITRATNRGLLSHNAAPEVIPTPSLHTHTHTNNHSYRYSCTHTLTTMTLTDSLPATHYSGSRHVTILPD